MAKVNKNKFFGLNFEFGIAKDRNIASTLMGVAVRNSATNDWYILDPKTLTRKNIMGLKMGEFPVCYIPSNQYVPGKLYKLDGNYYYAKSINPDGTIDFLSAADGQIRTILPEKNMFTGINFVTEVVAFDASTMMNPASNENVGGNILAAVLMMQWAKGNDDEAEFSLDNISGESFNGLGSFLPLILASGGNLGNMFSGADGTPNFAMLMALGSGDNENSDLTQMLLLSQLLGGGNNAIANPFSSIFSPAQPQATVSTTEGSEVICDSCKSTYPAGTNFCPKCGSKTRANKPTCNKCGATLLDGATFCHKCGAKVGISTCIKCGTELSDGANFCPKCGNSVNAINTAETPAPTVPEVKSEETSGSEEK